LDFSKLQLRSTFGGSYLYFSNVRTLAKRTSVWSFGVRGLDFTKLQFRKLNLKAKQGLKE